MFVFIAHIHSLSELPCHQWAFVPYPHRLRHRTWSPTWSCEWQTNSLEASDKVSSAILREGFCKPDVSSASLFLISSSEARRCLHGKRISISGDSYAMQLYVGLADILLDDPSSTEMTNSPEQGKNERIRLEVLRERKSALLTQGYDVNFTCSGVAGCYHNKERGPKETLRLGLCEYSCFGLGGVKAIQACSSCLQEADVTVVATLVHLLEAATYNFSEISVHLNDFIKRQPQLVWGGGTAYNKAKIPYPYNETMPLTDLNRLQAKTFGLSDSVPYLNVFELTRSCISQWSNCTIDGGHSRRFVERMKAQLLLNLLCEPIPLPTCKIKELR
jgi:hypothetical protein